MGNARFEIIDIKYVAYPSYVKIVKIYILTSFFFEKTRFVNMQFVQE